VRETSVGSDGAKPHEIVRSLVLPLLLGSCVSAGIPDWIDRIPQDPAYLYAVGTYHGALDPADNRSLALDNARRGLALSMKARVVLLSESERSLSHQRWASAALVSSDQVLQHSQEVAAWKDWDGLYGPRGAYWVLIRIPKTLADG
jgi:hypothetical protein